MSQGRIIADPFRFAKESGQLAGSVPLVALGRLGDLLLDRVGDVAYTLGGEIAADGQPSLRLTATGIFRMRCQRCLGEMEWVLDLESVLRLVKPGAEIPDEELEIDEFDVIEANADMDVLALVEDEILLAVPVVPRHDSCDAPRPLGGDEKQSPFAAIAALRKQGGAG